MRLFFFVSVSFSEYAQKQRDSDEDDDVSLRLVFKLKVFVSIKNCNCEIMTEVPHVLSSWFKLKSKKIKADCVMMNQFKGDKYNHLIPLHIQLNDSWSEIVYAIDQ